MIMPGSKDSSFGFRSSAVVLLVPDGMLTPSASIQTKAAAVNWQD
jgi:hypothetical protein